MAEPLEATLRRLKEERQEADARIRAQAGSEFRSAAAES